MLANVATDFTHHERYSIRGLVLNVAILFTLVSTFLVAMCYYLGSSNLELVACILGTFFSASAAILAKNGKTRIASGIIVLSSLLVVVLCLVSAGDNPFIYGYFLPISIAILYFDFSERQRNFLYVILLVCIFGYFILYSFGAFPQASQAPSQEVMLTDLFGVIFLIAVLMLYARISYSKIKKDIKLKMIAHNDQVDAVERSKLFLFHRKLELEHLREESQLKLHEQRKQLSKVKAHQEQLKQFAYAASHDLKEPIRTIRSFLQIVKRKIPAEELNTDLQEYFSFVDVNTSAMHDVLERLLVYSRVQQVDDLPQPINLFKFIAQAVLKANRPDLLESCVKTLPAKLAKLDVLALPIHGPVLLAEIIANADKFYPLGTNDRMVELNVEHQGSFVEINVLDQGIGIDSAYTDQVFGLFQRLNSKEDYPGAGLGLSIAKAIAIRSGATIEVKQRDGGGTCVSLKLQLAG